jgi:NADH-quinone oxidoreductase subunit M
LFLVVLTGLLFPLAMIAVNPGHDSKGYYAWLLLLQAGCFGVFVALDLFMFFVFFEIVLVPMYFLIAKWGHGNAKYAANKFFLFTMLGSALMLVSIVALVSLQSRDAGTDVTFNLVEIAENLAISEGTARWLFLGFALAFAVKVPVFPLHTWLPDAHTEAPTAGSVVLAAVMLKLGTYGFLRLGIELFPEASVWAAPVLMTLGVIGITYGAIAATMQKDLKRLVAYSSVAHLGFIILGMFSLTLQGIEGGILIMVNHGITTGALFLLVGMIYERRHTRLISELSGLQKVAPVLAAVFTTVMLASVGLPGLNGFPGELLALVGAFSGARWWGVVAVTGVILAALYLLWAYQRTFHGPVTPQNASMIGPLTEGS